jgi:hypothetical protein
MGDNKQIQVVKLHEHPNLLQQTANLLIQEWGDPWNGKRLMELNRSRDSLPCSLVLVIPIFLEEKEHDKLVSENSQRFMDGYIIIYE